MPGRFYLSTPIYYPNDRPHLGTAYTMVLADGFARWHRLIGEDVFLLTGVDEHGLKIARSAAENDMSPQRWVDDAATWFIRAWDALGISNDDFIRTTEGRHRLAVQQFMQAIYDNGYITKGEYAGWYCVSCEAYYSGEELHPGQLCPVHDRPVEWLVEENYFFKLSEFEDQLMQWYSDNPDVVVPESRRNEALGFIRQGLNDISVTRTSFDWGIPVPWDPSHVVYVWYDALINYVTAVGYGSDEKRFATWWPNAHHLIGKDIVKFHCVWWPAMCMAAGIEPPSKVIAHGWLLVSGEKMSKSRANQIDPLELAEDVGVDPLRYHLLRDIVLGSDGDFSYEGLIGRYNADLANNLGNLVQRVATVVGSKCDGIGPACRPADDAPLARVTAQIVAEVHAAWQRFSPADALSATWQLVRETNAALESAEPWKMEPGPEVSAELGDALEVLRIVTILASPAIPATCREIWRRLGLSGEPDAPGRGALIGGALDWGGYPGGAHVVRGEPLFPRRRVEEA